MPRKSSKQTWLTLGGIAATITFIGVVLALLNDTFDLLDRFAKEPSLPASSKTVDVPDETKNSFFATFPYYVGNQWNYTYSISTPDTSVPANPIEKIGTFSEKVTMVTTGYQDSVRIFTIEQQGEAITPECFGLGSLPDAQKYWVVANDEQVFVTCDETKASKLAMELRLLIDPRHTPTPELSAPTYLLPLEAGKLWPMYPGLPPRDDTAYQWHVDSRLDVSVPAGNFTGCYRILLFTGPDDSVRYICPGIGLVAAEYHHKGMPVNYRFELASYNFVSKP